MDEFFDESFLDEIINIPLIQDRTNTTLGNTMNSILNNMLRSLVDYTSELTDISNFNLSWETSNNLLTSQSVVPNNTPENLSTTTTPSSTPVQNYISSPSENDTIANEYINYTFTFDYILNNPQGNVNTIRSSENEMSVTNNNSQVNSDFSEYISQRRNAINNSLLRQQMLSNLSSITTSEEFQNMFPYLYNLSNNEGTYWDNLLGNIFDENLNNYLYNLQDVKITLDESRFDDLDNEIISQDENDNNCFICLENYKKDDIVTKLPCKHRFHKNCIKTWLCKENTRCPVCRKDTRKSSTQNSI
jgi:hypothetical protein